MRLLQMLERSLGEEASRPAVMREHYIARLVDLFDMVALAMRVTHA
jgi:hypothetical protein